MNSKTNRILTSFLIGIPITFSLFLLMSTLIETKANPPPQPPFDTPELDKVSYEDDLTTIIRHDLPEPDVIQELPANPSTDPEPQEPTEPTTEVPEFGEPLFGPGTINGSSFIPGGSNNTGDEVNQEAMPILISEPRWPRGANTNGFVRLCFTIMPDGKPTDIVVASSEPGRVFVKNAKRAVYKWKFKPSYLAGVAVEQSNMCYTMEFNIEE